MSETHIEPPAPLPGGTPSAPPAEPSNPAPKPSGKSLGKPAGERNGSGEGDGAGNGEPPAGEAPTWPEDWRDRFVKKAPATDREKLAKRLNRFSSPDNLLGSFLELDRQVNAGVLKRTLTENASPEEVAEYRKSHGIPAEPTVEAYGIKFPEGYEPNDADKADVGEFLTEMHKINAPPAFVQAAWNRYLGTQAKVQQQLHDAAQAATVERKAEIRAEYGRDYERNMRVGNAFLAQQIGEEKAGELAATVLSDGTRLGDHPDFVRLFVTAALASADDTALVTTELGTGQSVDEALKAAIELEYTDFEKWRSPDHQAKLQKLNAAKQRKKAA